MNNNTIALVFLIVGTLLLVTEAFIPDFGIVGLSGIASVVVAILIYSGGVLEAVLLLAVFAAILAVVFLVLSRSFRRGNSKFVLKDREDPDKGYTAPRNDESLVGKKGVAETNLHPSGAVIIDGQRIDVVSRGEYIKKGKKVIITAVEGRKIVVQKEDKKVWN